MSKKDLENRRIVLKGYPMPDRTLTGEEIEEYFSHEDSIRCLQCGRGFRVLSSHLKKIHELTTDEYRYKYGLPYGTGLCCKSTKRKAAIHGKNIHKKYILPKADEYRKLAHAEIRENGLRVAKSTAQKAKKNLRDKREKPFCEKDFNIILKYMIDNNKNMTETMNHFIGVRKRGKTAFFCYMRKNKDAKKRYDKACRTIRSTKGLRK